MRFEIRASGICGSSDNKSTENLKTNLLQTYVYFAKIMQVREQN
jgi:hypothetical protein